MQFGAPVVAHEFKEVVAVVFEAGGEAQDPVVFGTGGWGWGHGHTRQTAAMGFACSFG